VRLVYRIRGVYVKCTGVEVSPVVVVVGEGRQGVVGCVWGVWVRCVDVW
jgi:hypothetical protein